MGGEREREIRKREGKEEKDCHTDREGKKKTAAKFLRVTERIKQLSSLIITATKAKLKLPSENSINRRLIN